MRTQTLDVAAQGMLTTNSNADNDRHYYVITNRNGGGSVAHWLPVTRNHKDDQRSAGGTGASNLEG